MEYREEKMSGEFTKHLLDFQALNGNFHMVLHHFTGADKGGPHDHPFAFTTHILGGGYTERVFNKFGDYYEVFRAPGTSHRVEADCIHEIIYLPEGECWTVIRPETKTREPGFWRFDNEGSWFRQWNGDWKKITS